MDEQDKLIIAAGVRYVSRYANAVAHNSYDEMIAANFVNELLKIIDKQQAALDAAQARVNRLEEAMMMVCRSDK